LCSELLWKILDSQIFSDSEVPGLSDILRLRRSWTPRHSQTQMFLDSKTFSDSDVPGLPDKDSDVPGLPDILRLRRSI